MRSLLVRVLLHADPRRLLVRMAHQEFQLHLLVLHAPYVGGRHTGDQVSQWWQHTFRLAHQFECSHSLILMADANAPIGTHPGPGWGGAGAEPHNEAGVHFGQFVTSCGLCLPATFDHLHSSVHYTWTHPRGNRSRKDYIMVSRDIFPMVTRSWVDTQHDTTFAHEDHLPVGVHLQGDLDLSPQAALPQLDSVAMLSPAACSKFQAALRTLPIPDWSVNVDDHAALWEKHLLQIGLQHVRTSARTTHKFRLQQDTLDRIAFKRQALDLGRSTGCLHEPRFKEPSRKRSNAWFSVIKPSTTTAWSKVCKSQGNLVTARHCFFCFVGAKRARQPRGPRPLPILLRPDGQPVASVQERQQLWRRTFADTEAGLITTMRALAQMHSGQINCVFSELDIDAFPSRWQLMGYVRKLKRGKAPGPNAIPSDLLKAAGPVVVDQMLSLITKIVATSKEPLDWKGGQLVPLWKGKLSHALPEAYRSIFVSNFTTKLFHQCLRHHLVTAWTQRTNSLQCGGRPGYGPDIAAHIVHAHHHMCKIKKLPSAIVFFDVKAAFYTLLRQGLTQKDIDPTYLLRFDASSSHAAPGLRSLVASLLREAEPLGLSQHVDSLLVDLLTHMHFRVAGRQEVCLTTKGTRPGDHIGYAPRLPSTVSRSVLSSLDG